MDSDDGYKSPTSLFKNSKKAQAAPEAQFNWIFILIVGAIIIAFFSVVILKQKASSEVQVSGKLTQQLNTVFIGAKVSSGTVQVVSTPNFAVRFACNDYYLGAASQRLGNRIIFAPENFEGRDVITWTADWNAPYKIGTFLYVTNSNVRYVIVDAGADADEIKTFDKTLPMKLNREEEVYSIVDITKPQLDDMVPLAESSVRFIFLGTDTPSDLVVPPAFSDRDVSAIYIDTTTKELYFLNNRFEQIDSKIPYLDYESMFGAVFSDNPKIYECVMERAFSNWNVVNQVMKKKMELIEPLYSNTVCESLYSNDHYTTINDNTQEFNKNSINLLASAINGLRDVNGQAQLSSCPLLY